MKKVKFLFGCLLGLGAVHLIQWINSTYLWIMFYKG